MRFWITFANGFSLAIAIGALNSCSHPIGRADKEDRAMVAGVRGSRGPLAPPAPGKLTPGRGGHPGYGDDFAPVGDTHARVTADMIEAYKIIVRALEGVHDEASAKKAAKTIEGMKSTMTRLQERADALGKPDKELERRLMEEFEPDIGR